MMHNRTQEEVAKDIGASRQTIGGMEKNRYVSSNTLTLKLSRKFDVNVKELFNRRDDRTITQTS